MATKLSNVKYFDGGTGGASSVIGWESNRTRVVRFEFTSGSTGGTSITLRTTAGTIRHQDGKAMSKIPFHVTTSSSSHKKALQSEGAAVTGYLTKNDNNTWSGTANVVLKENTKYYVWFFPYDKTYNWSYWHNNEAYYTTYEVSGTSKFTLSTSAGTGSNITVNRTTSVLGTSLAPVGNLSNGATVYKGDKLQITFTPSDNYGIDQHTVNGASFTSGNTHTVSSDVAVVATAYLLASNIGATDANIGSRSTITITKFNSNYYHSLQYSFGSLSGYITSAGNAQDTEFKFSETSVSFAVPESFYEQIPNSATGICEITCRTYSSADSSTVLGDPSVCTFTVTAVDGPTISGTLIDTNPATYALTGDHLKVVRYRSNVKCTAVATPRHNASIALVSINNETVNAAPDDNGVVTAEKSFNNTISTSYTFYAVDSRGIKASTTLNPTVINYIELTCFPVISRPTPTGSEVVMSISGALYRGSFGVASNSIMLEYRYKTSDGSYCEWRQVDPVNIVLGSSSYTVTNLSVGDDFDYKASYIFQVRAKDGAIVDGTNYTLSTVTKTVEMQKGLPIFDWGENDFNVNVPIIIGSGTVGVPSGVLKRFENGVWIGNAAPISDDGAFIAKDGYHGFFIDTDHCKVYVVSDNNMQNVYTGDTIAKFG